MKKFIAFGFFFCLVIGWASAQSLERRVQDYEQAVVQYESAVNGLASKVLYTNVTPNRNDLNLGTLEDLRKRAEAKYDNVVIAYRSSDGKWGTYHDEEDLEPFNQKINDLHRRERQADKTYADCLERFVD
jgi:hypothetical protein